MTEAFKVHCGPAATSEPVALFPNTADGYTAADKFAQALNAAYRKGYCDAQWGSTNPWTPAYPEYYVSLVHLDKTEQVCPPFPTTPST